jgi:Zn-dependent peptidase ImmA (M78 family)
MMISQSERIAQGVLQKYYLTDPSGIELPHLLGCEGILFKTTELSACQGNMIRFGRNGIININKAITNPHKIRYVISHELGHWFMHKDSQLFACTEDDLNEWNSTTNSLEQEANTFASSFLMPRIPFQEFTQGRILSQTLIISLQERFNVSLTAASLRYVQIGQIRTMMVYSIDGVISWSAGSPGFEFQFFDRVRGTRVPDRSLTGKYFNGKSGETKESPSLSNLWFPKDYNARQDVYLNEIILPLAHFNACITFLISHDPLK